MDPVKAEETEHEVLVKLGEIGEAPPSVSRFETATDHEQSIEAGTKNTDR